MENNIRELAMRLSRDIGPTSFPTVTVEYLGFTEDALERLVRAAMREAYMRAADLMTAQGQFISSAAICAEADAILKESGEPVKYGCHCELGPGESPDGCVIDEGRPLDCVYTRQSSKAGVERKEDCEHWRPIK